MKLRKLTLTLLPLASTCVVAPAITSCNGNNQKADEIVTVTHDEAKAWVKANYGATSKTYSLTKSESEWSFAGFVTSFGGVSADAGARTGWLYNHLDAAISTLSFVDNDDVMSTEVDRGGATKATGIEDKGICKLGDIAFNTDNKKVKELSEVVAAKQWKTLAEDSFDLILDDYYNGVFKYNADYTINKTKKTINVLGTCSNITTVTYDGVEYRHNLKMPFLNLTFDSEGRIIKIAFNFENATPCTYQWQQTTGSSAASDGYSFVILPGGKIVCDYTVSNVE